MDDERTARERRPGARIDAQAARRSASRDEGLRRLRKLTRASVMGATALVGLFAFVAAKALPGHKLHASTPSATVASSSGGTANPDPSSAAPSLSASSAAPSLSPPASSPASSAQSPVVVSGGS